MIGHTTRETHNPVYEQTSYFIMSFQKYKKKAIHVILTKTLIGKKA